jgi:hypothetical protein
MGTVVSCLIRFTVFIVCCEWCSVLLMYFVGTAEGSNEVAGVVR